MAIWTLLSRVLGFVRDAVMLAVLGASAGQGAFLLAWTIPNLFRKLLGEGAVSAAVQPALTNAEAESGEGAAKSLFASFQGFLLLVLVGIVVLGELIILLWRSTLDPTLADDAELLRTLGFTALLLPYVIPICLCALAAAPQNLRQRFLLPSLAPVLLNVVWITGLVWTSSRSEDPERILQVLWIWVLVGGILQWGLQWRGLRAIRWPILPRFRLGDRRRNRALAAFVPAMIGMAALQVNVALDQVLVRGLVDDAANNYSFYANRMLHLPLALVGVAAMTGSMPLFSRLAASRRLEELSGALRRGCESTLLLICAAGIGMAVVGHPLLSLLFQRGAFTPEDVDILAPTLNAYLWVLPFATVGGLLTRAHQSLGSYRLPALAALVSVPVNLALDWFLLPIYGVPGAGWATTASMAVQTLILMSALPAVGLRRPVHLRSMPGVLLPAMAAGGAAQAMMSYGPDPYSIPGIALAIAAGVAAGGAATLVLRPQDFKDLLGAVRRRAG